MYSSIKNNIGERLVILTTAEGSGTKLLQSFLDSHPELIMIPGYPLMYLLPFIDSKNLLPFTYDKADELLEILKFQFDSIFDSRKRVGSEGLDKLGEALDQYLTVDFDSFSQEFNQQLKLNPQAEYSAADLIILIHIAYSGARRQNVDPYTCKIVYHMHEDVFVDRYLKNIGTRLFLTRCKHSHIKNRVINSFHKPNISKLPISISLLIKHFGPTALSQLFFYARRSLSQTCSRQIWVKHEDLVLNPSMTLQDLSKDLDLKFTDTLTEQSFGGLIWNSTFYNWEGKSEGKPNLSVINSQYTYKKNIFEYFDALRVNTIYSSYYNDYSYSNILGIASGQFPLYVSLWLHLSHQFMEYSFTSTC